MNTQSDPALRRKLDAEMMLQADPVLRECVEVLDNLVTVFDQGALYVAGWDAKSFDDAIERARALLAKLRGEQP